MHKIKIYNGQRSEEVNRKNIDGVIQDYLNQLFNLDITLEHIPWNVRNIVRKEAMLCGQGFLFDKGFIDWEAYDAKTHCF